MPDGKISASDGGADRQVAQETVKRLNSNDENSLSSDINSGEVPDAEQTANSVGNELNDQYQLQLTVQKTIMKFSTMSNLAHATHTNKKSMSDKIGQS